MEKFSKMTTSKQLDLHFKLCCNLDLTFFNFFRTWQLPCKSNGYMTTSDKNIEKTNSESWEKEKYEAPCEWSEQKNRGSEYQPRKIAAPLALGHHAMKS